MDLFTQKANSIIKQLNEMHDEEDEVIYSSDEEENAEDPQMKKMGLDKASIAAVGVARDLATQASKSGIPGFRADPQKEINQAYGKLMTTIAKKINTIASNIK